MGGYKHPRNDNASRGAPSDGASRCASGVLLFRNIEGLPLYSEGDRKLLKDLDIAALARLSQPRTVRRAVRTLVADGVQVIGPAAAAVLKDIEADRDKSQGNAGEIGDLASESSWKDAADGDRAIIWAEKEVVSVGAFGRSQEVTAFYLNKLAALRLIMRLRTPMAVEMQDLVCRVFILADEGRLPSSASGAYPVLPPELLAALPALAVLPTLLARVEALETRPYARTAPGPAIGPGAARTHILDPLKQIARTKAKAIKNESPEAIRSLRFSAERDLRRTLKYDMGANQRWENFPEGRIGEVACAIARMKGEADRLAGVAAGLSKQLRLKVVK